MHLISLARFAARAPRLAIERASVVAVEVEQVIGDGVGDILVDVLRRSDRSQPSAVNLGSGEFSTSSTSRASTCSKPWA